MVQLTETAENVVRKSVLKRSLAKQRRAGEDKIKREVLCKGDNWIELAYHSVERHINFCLEMAKIRICKPRCYFVNPTIIYIC